ncbi:hypothetical protein KB151_003898 [[Clostridium] innocuum]|nr:hypothetical protein [[Clostridium] innocuum]
MNKIEKANKTIIIKQDKYPIPPVIKAMKNEGFKWCNSKGYFKGKVTDENRTFLKLLGYIKD